MAAPALILTIFASGMAGVVLFVDRPAAIVFKHRYLV
jgi:hypothetical protein